MIVDDTAADALLLERLLTPEGYIVGRALDGQEALEVVARSAPDLILTDVRMPRRNGFDLCRRAEVQSGDTTDSQWSC